MAAVLDRINKGTHVETDRGMTFSRHLDEWLAEKLRLRPSTRISYTHHVELYFKPGLGHVRLASPSEGWERQQQVALRHRLELMM